MKKIIKYIVFVLCVVILPVLIADNGLAAGLFSEVRILGYMWGKPNVTVAITPQKGAEGYVGDVVSVVSEWNTILETIHGAPTLALQSTARADITVLIVPGEGKQLGYAGLRTAIQESCVLDNVEIVLYTKVRGRAYSHSGMRNIFRHEMAHALGLGHSNDDKEQMFAYAQEDVFFGRDDIQPSECEIKGLRLLYPVKPYCIVPEKVECF